MMNDHDSGDPLSYLNAIEAAWLCADSTRVRCPHGCNVQCHVVPMSGAGWAVDETHEITCPIHEDHKEE